MQKVHIFVKTISMEEREYYTSITIPTYQYLRKFALHRYKSTTGRIQISKRRFVGLLLLSQLQKKNYQSEPAAKSCYNSKIVVDISEYYMKVGGIHMDVKNVDNFNNLLKFEFEENMYDHLLMVLVDNKNAIIEQEILKFLTFYNISEDEIKMESVKKDFYRWRQDRNIVIIK